MKGRGEREEQGEWRRIGRWTRYRVYTWHNPEEQAGKFIIIVGSKNNHLKKTDVRRCYTLQ